MSADRVDRLSEVLLDAGAQSLTLGDAGDVPVLEPGPGETPLWPHVELAALFPLDTAVGALRTALIAELGAEFEHCELDVQFVADADWSQTWREFAIDHCFGGRLWIVPRDAAAAPRSGVTLRLDPGLAFGTGGHATTAMCLEWLSLARLDGASVVDYGAGSGILGIAALLLGAADVIAVDHDPQARLATLENATYNGVTARTIERGRAGPAFVHAAGSRIGEHTRRTVGDARAGVDGIDEAGRDAGDVGNAGASTRRGVA